MEKEIPPGAYELFELSNAIQQELINSCNHEFLFNIEADTIEIPPGAYELFEIKIAIQQELNNFCNHEFKFNIEADTISMKSVLTTSFSIYFFSELNILLGITNKSYPAVTHISKKPVWSRVQTKFI